MLHVVSRRAAGREGRRRLAHAAAARRPRLRAAAVRIAARSDPALRRLARRVRTLAPGARIVLECKQANYTLAKALEEIEARGWNQYSESCLPSQPSCEEWPFWRTAFYRSLRGQVAKKNRAADVGIFVWSAASAPDGLEPLARCSGGSAADGGYVCTRA